MNANPSRVSRVSLELYSDYVAPTTTTEEKLIAIWSKIFEVDGLGIDDDFFDLGGDSVIATRLTSEITKTFGAKFMVGTIVERPTIRQIAETMFLAEKTVKNYVSDILAKLGLSSRTQAAVLAVEHRTVSGVQSSA